jgi:hypothetical protein
MANGVKHVPLSVDVSHEHRNPFVSQNVVGSRSLRNTTITNIKKSTKVGEA